MLDFVGKDDGLGIKGLRVDQGRAPSRLNRYPSVKMNDDIAACPAFGKLTEKLVDSRARLQSVMVRLPLICDHQGDPKRGNQEQQQRGDVAAVVHPQAVVGLGEEEIAGKPGRNRRGDSVANPHRTEAKTTGSR